MLDAESAGRSTRITGMDYFIVNLKFDIDTIALRFSNEGN